jgi:hypothetical protein
MLSRLAQKERPSPEEQPMSPLSHPQAEEQDALSMSPPSEWSFVPSRLRDAGAAPGDPRGGAESIRPRD